MKRALGWLADHHFQIITVVAAWAVGEWIGQSAQKIERLESRGWVPADDVATIADLIKLEGRLAGDPLPAPADRDEIPPDQLTAD